MSLEFYYLYQVTEQTKAQTELCSPAVLALRQTSVWSHVFQFFKELHQKGTKNSFHSENTAEILLLYYSGF